MPAPTQLLFACLTGTLVLALVYYHLYRQDPVRYLLTWAAGWGVFSLSLGLQALGNLALGGPLLQGLWLAALWAAFSLMYTAIRRILKPGPERELTARLLGGALLVGAAGFFSFGADYGDPGDPRSLIGLGGRALLACLPLATGLSTRRMQAEPGLGRPMTGISFGVMGILVVLYPLLQNRVEAAAWWWPLSTVVELTCATGMALIYFEHTREELKRKNAQLENLLGAARQLTTSLEVTGVLENIGREAVEILNAYSCTLYMLSEDGQRLTPVVAIDPEFEQEVLSAELQVEASLNGQAVLQRRGLIFNDPFNHPAMFQVPGTPVECEEHLIAAPLLDREQVLGVICLARIGVDFTEEDLALAETFAAYASTALKNARSHLDLQREVHERLKVLQALRESESRFRGLFEGAPISLWEADFSGVKDYVQELEQAGVKDLRAFCAQNPEEIFTILRRVNVLGINRATELVLGIRSLQELDENLARIFTPELTTVVTNSVAALNEGNTYFESETLIHKISGEPVHISLRWTTAPGYEDSYGRVLISLLDITQQKLGQSALERKAYQQGRLLDTARHLAESLDVRQVLERIGAGVRDLIAADGCTIYLLSEDGLWLNPMVVVDPYFSDQILASPLQVEGSLTGQAVLQQRGLIYNDAMNAGVGVQIPGTPVDEQENVIVAPYMVDGEVLGAMCLDRTGAIFTPDDLSLAMTFAAYASMALKNARAHTRLGEANEALQREIVERQQTEAALLQAHAALAEGEERYRTLFENSPISLWDEDFSGVKRYLDDLRASGVEDLRAYFDEHPQELNRAMQQIRLVAVNRATVELFEAPDSESLLADLSRITIDDSYEGMKESILAVGAGARQFEYETSNRTLSGKRIEISLRWTVAPGCEESYEKLLLSIVDITERRRAHAALQASESRFRGLFEDSPVSLWEEDFSGVKRIVDEIREREGFPTPGVEELREYLEQRPEEIRRCCDTIQILDVNPATLKLYRAADRQELTGSLGRILNNIGYATNLQEILAVAAGERECEFETRNLTVDGEPIWVALKWSAASGHEDSYAKVLVSVVDITARKKAEEAMHAAHSALAEANLALQRKTHALERLLETARQLTSSLEVKQVLESIARGALEILESYSCSIFMLDEGGSRLRPVVVIDPDYQEEMQAVVVDVDASLTGQAVKQRRSLLFNEPLQDPSTFQIPGTPVELEERIIVAPFVDGEEVLGAMCIARMGTCYSGEDLALAETFAAYASSALRNARAHAGLSEAHEALQESEERYRSLFEDNHSVMLLLDPETTEIVDANPSACRFYGYERAQLVDRRLTEIPIIDESEAERTLTGAENGLRRHFLSAHRLAGGEIHPVEIYCSTIRMNGKQLLYAIVNDITQRLQRERELETIVRVASALRSAQTRAEMAPVILQQVSELLNAEGAALAMLDSRSGEAVFELGIGAAAEMTGRRLPVECLQRAAAPECLPEAQAAGNNGQGAFEAEAPAAAAPAAPAPGEPAELCIAAGVIATGAPYLRNELGAPGSGPEGEAPRHAALAAVPLIAQDQTIGALTIGRSSAMSEADVRLFNAVGEMAANALYRETLNEETQQYAASMAAVSAIGRSLAETLDLGQVYERLAASILDLFPAARSVLITRYDPERALIIPEYGVQDGEPVRVSKLPVFSLEANSRDPQSRVIRERRPLIAPEQPGRGGNGRRQERAGLYVPLLAKGEILGVIQLRSRAANCFTEREAGLLAIVGQIGAIAIQNARLFHEIQRRVNRLDAQHSIDKAISGSFDLGVTLSLVVEQMTRHLGVDAADVLLFDPVTQKLIYAAGAGFRTNALTPSGLRLGKGYAGQVALTRRMISIPDLAQHLEELENGAGRDGNLRASLTHLQAEGFQAYFGMPLIAKGQIKGVLELYRRSPFLPDQEWLSFLDAVVYQSAIAIDNTSLFNDLQHSNRELTLTIDTTLEGWANALELRDLETKNHSRRVVEEAVKVARAMGVSGDNLMHIRRGALLHDIGKMGIPDQILNKPGPLTPEEWEVMKQHPVHAFKLLSSIPFLRPALDIPYAHHERWDGSGYPRGLKGEEIPMAARIFAVVDVWDALLNDRPYRPPWPVEKVRAYLQEQAGKQFDPRVVEVFLSLERSED